MVIHHSIQHAIRQRLLQIPQKSIGIKDLPRIAILQQRIQNRCIELRVLRHTPSSSEYSSYGPQTQNSRQSLGRSGATENNGSQHQTFSQPREARAMSFTPPHPHAL
jgi:hypothetical protein